MSKYLTIYAIILILFTPSLAFGQEYTRYVLPEGRRCTVLNITYQCYSIDEYRSLLTMDNDLRLFTETHEADINRIAQLSLALEDIRTALVLAEEDISTLEIERTRLTEMWEEENRLRLEAENRPSLEWLPWTLAGGFAISTIILSLIVGLGG